MSTPETPAAPPPAPAPVPAPKKTVGSRLAALYVFALSAEGRKDIGALVALATALYTALHRAGV